MRLISKATKVNEITFVPECVITIAIPLEAMQDAQATLGEKELKEVLGHKLIELLKS